MDLPLDLPVSPMLARAVTAVPEPEVVPGGLAYEPKWDGFRCIVLRDGDEVELASRGAKPLTRYFPEVVETVRSAFPERCAVDAEIIVRAGAAGSERLSWEALTARIHPAASRVALLARETPAELVCFDLLAEGSTGYLDEPFSARRAALERLLQSVRSPSIHVTQLSADPDVARDWLERFEGAGLDGVVAKPLAGAYTPGKRTMLKVKHKRTADAVVYGYRVHKSGRGVGSLLLGLYTDTGQLVGVGGIAAFSDRQRLALVEELEPLVHRDEEGTVLHAETERSRFSASKDVSFVPLRPDRVVEVAFDQMEGHRFRHTVTFLRWRPDREPESCLLEQVERAPAYDLGEVLTR